MHPVCRYSQTRRYTCKSNERSLLRTLVRILGSKKLRSLTFDDLEAYRTKRGEVEGKSNRTINLELRILVRVLKEEGLWKGKLKANYKALPENDGNVPHALTTKQLGHPQKTASTKDGWLVAYLATVLAANSAMRAGEIRKTTLGVVDLEKPRTGIRRRAAKTNKGARIIELNDQAFAAVRILHKRALMHGSDAADRLASVRFHDLRIRLSLGREQHSIACGTLDGGTHDANRHRSLYAHQHQRGTCRRANAGKDSSPSTICGYFCGCP